MASRVLVIDDSPMLLELTVKALQGVGLDAAGAVDLATLDERLTTGAFDLILVDVNMPEMFGDDVVEFLKVQRGVRSKLVLYSDIPEVELAEKVRTAGADGFISKSGGIEALLHKVGDILGISIANSAAQRRKTGEMPAVQAPAAGASAPASEKKKKRVLVVDDSEMTARLLEADLTAKGFEVFTADTADKATKIILKKQTRPDLVLLDVRMPNVNGEQFCRFIKGNSLFSGIKVLLCSGEDPEELKRICREAGADGFVAKDAVLSKVLAGELSS